MHMAMTPLETKPFELDSAVKRVLAWQGVSRGRGRRPVAGESGSVPQGWLQLVDERSYAGPGHAVRTGHIALAVAAAAGFSGRIDEAELLVAAWSHELGRLSTETSDPVTTAGEGGRLLKELGCAAGVVAAVRHLHERWDGSGGPAGRRGDEIPVVSQLLAVADTLDHYVAAWLQADREPVEAVDRALGLVRVQAGSVFSPTAAEAALQVRGRIISICGLVATVVAVGGAAARPVCAGTRPQAGGRHGRSRAAGEAA
jgi:hypothetical protein